MGSIVTPEPFLSRIFIGRMIDGCDVDIGRRLRKNRRVGSPVTTQVTRPAPARTGCYVHLQFQFPYARRRNSIAFAGDFSGSGAGTSALEPMGETGTD